ncbi:MAG: patatin-like phospholipase family protein [Mycolicibacterium insubricum]|nr:patatin-like phospholipase family protein [Mycobacterium sp.]
MRVALALGSGGARGYAHIGAIAELRARGHEIAGIAGSSMGALVGGLEAAGHLDDFTAWAQSLTQPAVLRLLDPSLGAAGILRAEKILNAVKEIVSDVTVQELPIPFTSVSTDLIAGRSVWIQRGPLTDAIRASIAIPGVIEPYLHDGRLLADGGILDPIPMAPIAAVSADATIAISLAGGDPDRPTGYREARSGSDRVNRMMRSTMGLLDSKAVRSLLETQAGRNMLGRFNLIEAPDADIDPDAAAPAATPRLGGFEVMNRTIDIAQSALARHALAANPADLVIEVPRTVCRSLDFHRAAEVIETGRALTGTALDRWEEGS